MAERDLEVGTRWRGGMRREHARMRRWTWPLLAAALIGSATPTEAAVAGGLDYLGRSLADANGPIAYRWNGSAWSARSGDGRTVAAVGPAPIVETARAAGFTLAPYEARSVGSWPDAVAIGDVTGDGRNDVVLTTGTYFDADNDYHVFVFPGRADGGLDAPTKYPYLAPTNRTGLVLADLDEDGLLDVVVGHRSGISVLLADGGGGLAPSVVFADGDADSLATMDVDRDGHADVISLGWTRGATIFFGDGLGGFPRKQALATNAAGYNDHEVGDLNGDGVLDLAVMSGQLYAVPNLSVHRHDGVAALGPAPDTYFMGTNELSGGIGLGDVSGDGRADAVLSRPRNSPTHLWLMTQDAGGTLGGPMTVASYDIPESLEVADLNGDGREDVAVVHGGWNRLGVYLQRAGGGLDPEVLYPIPYASHYGPQGLAVGDFSGDGCADIAIADYNYGLVTLRGQSCVPPPLPTPTPTPEATATVTPSATPTSVPSATATPSLAGCPPAPLAACARARRSQLVMRIADRSSGNRLAWQWENGSATKGDFGDPLRTTSFALCLYRDGALLLARTVLADGFWTESTGGFQYRNTATNADGIQRVVMRDGSERARIALRARRGNLVLPLFPLHPAAALTAQLVDDPASGTACWESIFTPPFAKDGGLGFRAKQ